MYLVKILFIKYMYITNFISIYYLVRLKQLKVTKGQFMHLVKFIYITFTYIPNFIPNSRKKNSGRHYQRFLKVTKGQMVYLVSILYTKICVYQISSHLINKVTK